MTATTSAHGAKSARKTDWRPLAGREVVILPDHDSEGEGYARAVMAELAKLAPRPTVRIVRLSDLWRSDGEILEGADIEEWLRTGFPRGGPRGMPGGAGTGGGRPRGGPGRPAPAEPRDEPEPPPIGPAWPDPPEAPALDGLAGEIIRAIEPHTEADPVAILVQLLIGFGNLIGRSAYFAVEADRHHTNEFAALVGDTAKGRKGTSWGHARRLLEAIDPSWATDRVMSGLSTGEGLIHAVRDPVFKREPIREGKASGSPGMRKSRWTRGRGISVSFASIRFGRDAPRGDPRRQ